MKVVFLIILIALNFSFSKQVIIKTKENINFPQTQKVIKKDKNQLRLLNAEQNDLLNELYKYHYINENELYNLNIEYEVIPNYKYKIETTLNPQDPLFSSQWEMRVTNALNAWRYSTGERVIIGLIDTGVDFEHPDLVNSLWINESEDINGNGQFDPWSHTEMRNGIYGDLDGIDQDGNGYVDDVIGYDMVDQEYANFGDWNTPDPIPFDEGRHGTSVAGVMVASANNIGIRGLAFNSKLMTVRAFDGGGEAESDDIANAIIYAVSNGAKVLNFSFGEPYSSPILRDAIRFAYSMGVVMVSSSGNNGWNRPHFPSDYPEVICVGGTNSDNRNYGFSNWGSFIDLVAPGHQVLSTEAFSSGYRRSSGTSMAAPFVSAASAMLFSLYPNMTPSEVRSLLQTTAFDLGERKWDTRFGAGLLDASRAVQTQNNADFEIHFPRFDDLFIKSRQNIIPIVGTTTIPLFDKWELYIGEGYYPDEITRQDEEKIAEELGISLADVFFLSEEEKMKFKWTLIDSSSSSIKNNKLADLSINNLRDTIYTLRLLIHTKNNNSVERRTKIRVRNNFTKLRFERFKIANAIDKGTKTYYFAGKTNLDCDIKITAINKDRLDTFYFGNTNFGGQYHYVKMNNLKDGNYDFNIEGITRFRDTTRISSSSNVSTYKFDKNSFVRKPYSFKRSYQLNKIGNFTNNRPQFIINDLTNLDINKTYLMEFNDNEFKEIDSSNNTYIPVDYADFNGDGKTDFLSSTAFETEIFLNSTPLLTNSAYKSSPEIIEWAEDTYDLNNDGKNEILCNNSSVYSIRSFINNKFEITDTLFPNGELAFLGFERGGIIDDFDNDGNPEAIIANRLGIIQIYEYVNGKFNNVNSITEQISLSRQFNSKITFPDGKKGFLNLNYGDSELFNERGSGRSIWTARLYKSTGNNTFEEIWRESFHGVRDGLFGQYPISYKNGVTTGNLNNEFGDEIVISVFPNLYVYEINNNDLKPLFHFDDAITNSTMIYDFDKNGTNEIAISTGFGTELFEFRNNQIPNLFITDAYALNNNSALIKWQRNNDFDGVEIYKLIENDIEFAAESENGDSVIITNLIPNTYYYFTAVPFKVIENNREYGNPLNYADIIEIFTHNPISPQNIINTTFNSIRVKFNGLLPKEEIESQNFSLFNENLSISPSKVLTSMDSTAILVFLDSIPEGDFTLSINSFRDFHNTPTINGSLNLNINYKVNEEIYLKRLEVQGLTLLMIEFSDEVAFGANNPNNYIMRPTGYVLSVDTIPNEANKVQMNVIRGTYDAIGKNYTIQVVNVYSKEGLPITTGPGNTLAFTYTANNLDECFVYPNPVSLKTHSFATIANITQVAEVFIFNINGNLIRTLQERDGNGGVEWDMRDNSGETVKPGVYLYKVNGKNEEGFEIESQLYKFAVVP